MDTLVEMTIDRMITASVFLKMESYLESGELNKPMVS